MLIILLFIYYILTQEIRKKCPYTIRFKNDFSFPAKIQKSSDCRRHRHSKINLSSNGYIASATASGTSGHINSNCPWRLIAQPGQRINLTLYDFSLFDQKNKKEKALSVCKRYAVVTERPGRESPICGGLERVRSVYLSSGYELDVRLFSDGARFLMHYQAVGCSRVTAPTNSHVQFNENTMIVICNNSNEKSYLTCKDNRWQGTIHNCSALESDAIWSMLADEWASPYGEFIHANHVLLYSRCTIIHKRSNA